MLRAKEVELEIKREESEAKRLRLRELELEIERDRFQRDHGRLHPTGSALENSPVSPSLARLPTIAPVPVSSSPVSAPLAILSPGFDVKKLFGKLK